jgi:hypothetical protein
VVNKLQQREWNLEEIDYVSEMPNKNYTSSLEGSSNRCVYLYFLDIIIITAEKIWRKCPRCSLHLENRQGL